MVVQRVLSVGSLFASCYFSSQSALDRHCLSRFRSRPPSPTSPCFDRGTHKALRQRQRRQQRSMTTYSASAAWHGRVDRSSVLPQNLSRTTMLDSATAGNLNVNGGLCNTKPERWLRSRTSRCSMTALFGVEANWAYKEAEDTQTTHSDVLYE